MAGEFEKHCGELVITFVNTQEANTSLINGSSHKAHLKDGESERILTTDPLPTKPRLNLYLSSENVLDKLH